MFHFEIKLHTNSGGSESVCTLYFISQINVLNDEYTFHLKLCWGLGFMAFSAIVIGKLSGRNYIEEWKSERKSQE